MNFRLIFQVAKRHLLSRRKQTIVAALGVTFGIAMFIAMVSFMTGVDKMLEDTMMSASPHIHIYNDIETKTEQLVERKFNGENDVNKIYHPKPSLLKQGLKNGLQMVNYIRKDEAVWGVSPMVNSQVFFNFGPHDIHGNITGVDIMAEDLLFDISSKMLEGKIEDLLSSNNSILMGSGLARKMNLHKGDNITITTPAGVSKMVKVAGIFQMGMAQVDDTRSYASINLVQKILQKDKSYITDINIKLKVLEDARQKALDYYKFFGYRADDWETTNATILVSIKLRGVITYTVSITLLIVAGFGIYNILNMTIYEKMRDIAILKATGFSGKDVMGIFMTQALSIGVVGGVVGLILGYVISFGISKVPFHAEGFLSIEFMPVNFAVKYYIIGMVFGLGTTAVAGFMPSRKAAGIDPVEIIRGK